MKKKWLWLIPAAVLSFPAAAAGVYEAHNKWPGSAREKGDCDHKECKVADPASVPEPATLPLLMLGAGVVWVVTRRRKP